MRAYEVVYILSDSQVSVTESCEKIRADFSTMSIKIKSEQDMGKRRFTYPIQKQNNGHYYLFNIESTPETIRDLSTHYKFNEHVLRHLIIKVDEKIDTRKNSGESIQQSSGESTQQSSGESTQQSSGESTQQSSGESTQQSSGESTQQYTAEQVEA